MQTKRGDFAVGYIGGKVIAAGGLGKDTNLSIVQFYEAYTVVGIYH